MKRRVAGLVFGMMLAGWAVPQAPAFFSATETSLKISITIPAASLDLSDLDVRDELNRPVSSIQKHDQLASLFSAGLNNLLMKNLTPAAVALGDVLSKVWNLLAGTFSASTEKALQFFSSIAPQKKFHFSHLMAFVFLIAALVSRWRASARVSFAHQNQLSSILSSTIILR